jgi:spore coat protein CotH
VRSARLPALLAACLLAPALVCADAKKDDKAVDGFFKAGKPLTIEIDIDKAGLESLRREPRKYVKCKLKVDGKEAGVDVGIHLKGAAGSTRPIDDKPGLTLNMDKFKKGQRFFGMDKWHLANSVQDATYLNELISGEIFRAAGVPASRIGHALVTISGRYRGLYYIKEGYDRGWRRRNFGDPTGNLYDGGFLRDIDQALQLIKGDGPKGHADLKELAKACGERDEKKRFERMEKLLDMDRFITYLVVEVITCDWDGYPTNRNNYRIYGDPRTKKLVFIPSGMDQMFGDVNQTIFPGYQGMAARAVIETKEGRRRYVARLAEVMKKLKPDELAKRVEDAIKPVQALAAEKDKNFARDLGAHAKNLGDRIKQRAASVAKQLKAELGRKK